MRHLLVMVVLSGACTVERTGESVHETHLSPPVRVANQNGFYNGTPTCAQKGVASIGTSWWLGCDTAACPAGSAEYNTFINTTQAEVECRLSVFLKNHANEFNATPDGLGCRDASGTILSACPIDNGVRQCWKSAKAQIIIMDLERPHPMDLNQYSNQSDRIDVENAYKTRIAAANSTFPLATIGLYGTVVPDGQGDANAPTYKNGHDRLVEAGNRGLFDNLDYLVPVVYPRFGCEEGATTTCTSTASARPWCDTQNNWNSYEAYTELGILGSIDLAPLPLLPLMTTRVHNGNSCFGQAGVLLFDMIWDNVDLENSADIVFAQTLAAQLAKMVELDNARTDVTISSAVLWTPDDVVNSGDTDVVLPAPNDHGWTLNDYTGRLCHN